jgi:thiamine biosynthesis lipoprotein ApbE
MPTARPRRRSLPLSAFVSLNNRFSDYLRDSELMQLCAQPSGVPVKVSPELFSVIEKAQAISAASEGAFDITTGHLSHLWRRSRRQKELPSAARLKEALAKTNWQWIQLFGLCANDHAEPARPAPRPRRHCQRPRCR